MIYAVNISDEAGVDLRGIYEYIAFDLLVSKTAANQLECIEKSILELKEMPKRFPLYQKEPWLSRGMRFVSVDNFIVYYIPGDEKKVVTVLRVLYYIQMAKVLKSCCLGSGSLKRRWIQWKWIGQR